MCEYCVDVFGPLMCSHLVSGVHLFCDAFELRTLARLVHVLFFELVVKETLVCSIQAHVWYIDIIVTMTISVVMRQ